MLKQSSGRNHRGTRLRSKHSLQVFLLVAVSIWLMYQLTHSYSKRRAVAVESDSGGMDGELTRRRLGRNDFVDFAGRASDDDVRGIRGGGSNAESEDDVTRDFASDRLSKGEEGGSDDEDDESDEDDDVLPGDEEEDDRNFQSENGDGEDELKTTRGKTESASTFGNANDGTHVHQPNELDGRVVPQVNATGGMQDGAPVPLVDGAAEYGIDVTLELNSSRSLSKFRSKQ